MESTDYSDSLHNLERLPAAYFPDPPVIESNQSQVVPPYKNRVIVVAYDHSDYGDAVIAKSIRLGLLLPTDDIRILHIVNQSDYRNLFNPLLSANSAYGIAHQELSDSTLENIADAFMYEVIQALRKNGFNQVRSEILRGDPKESIVDFCRMVKPLYVITGTRGLGMIKRTVMGSVSNFLTRHCPCPVMVIKLEQSEIDARKELKFKKDEKFADILNALNSSK